MTNIVFLYEDDANIKSDLYTLQATEVSTRSTLQNVIDNLKSANIQVPAFPEWIGDSDPVATRENTGSEYIDTTYVFNGAADFDWENTSRLENYADVAGVSVDSIDSSAERPDIKDNIPTEWYYDDNSVVTEPTKSEQALITQYETALTAYYSAKVAYQDKVAELIVSQDTYLSAMKNYTSSIGSNAVVGVTQKK
jgi:hypothetical protein